MPPESNPQPDASEVPLATDADTLAQVRDLLVGRELDEIRERVGAHAEDIAQVLPRAVTLREQQDDQLSRALASTVEGAIQSSVKRNPQPMIDAVFPVIGPAIRKAVADAMAKAVQSLNTTLEHSLSVRSFKWRLEAKRTGKSFAEVVLLHTLKYRVEQVFLIHKESGLLMQHLTAPGVE
ncbi:MAG: OmpA family protein, partial [Planctomycetota bacterium]